MQTKNKVKTHRNKFSKPSQKSFLRQKYSQLVGVFLGFVITFSVLAINIVPMLDGTEDEVTTAKAGGEDTFYSTVLLDTYPSIKEVKIDYNAKTEDLSWSGNYLPEEEYCDFIVYSTITKSPIDSKYELEALPSNPQNLSNCQNQETTAFSGNKLETIKSNQLTDFENLFRVKPRQDLIYVLAYNYYEDEKELKYYRASELPKDYIVEAVFSESKWNGIICLQADLQAQDPETGDVIDFDSTCIPNNWDLVEGV